MDIFRGEWYGIKVAFRKERKSETNKLEKRTKVVKLYGGNEVKWDTLLETTNPSELSLRNSPKKNDPSNPYYIFDQRG